MQNRQNLLVCLTASNRKHYQAALELVYHFYDANLYMHFWIHNIFFHLFISVVESVQACRCYSSRLFKYN